LPNQHQIAVDATDENFQKLFAKFVYEEAEVMTPASVAEPRLICGEVETRLFVDDVEKVARSIDEHEVKPLFPEN